MPTPLRDGAPDLSYIEDAAARRWRRTCGRARCVVLESTTYPGTTEELLAPILEAGLGADAGADFHLGYSPERIDPGNPTWHAREHAEGRLRHRRRVARAVAGASTTGSSSATVPVSSPTEAELTKLLENTFRHVNIALVNELAMFADDLGIDVWEAIDAASTKPFGFMRFTPGPGVGGHCLPIDPSYLSWRVRAVARPRLPLRRAGQRRQRPHARLRRAPAGSSSTAPQVRQRLAGPAARPGLQAQHRRRPGVAGRSVVDRLLASGAEVSAIDPLAVPHRDGRARRRGARRRLRGRATDHDDLDWDAVAAVAPKVLDTRRRLAGTPAEML